MVEGRMITLDLITKSFPSSVSGTHLSSIHWAYHSPLSESSNESLTSNSWFTSITQPSQFGFYFTIVRVSSHFQIFFNSLSQCRVASTFPIFSVKSILSSFKSFLWVLYKSFLYKMKAWSRKQPRQSVFTGTNWFLQSVLTWHLVVSWFQHYYCDRNAFGPTCFPTRSW